jgi:(heptosyl)LPS beta-1,4-glucosyltransferase
MDEPAALDEPLISAVVISCNEGDVIEPCLQSVKEWVGEIIVVDMHSSDETRSIVLRYTDKLYDTERLTYADPARNLALSLARGKWILMLDPDERVPVELAEKLSSVAHQDACDVVVVPRSTEMCGILLQASGCQYDRHPRFFRRGVISWPKEVHGHPMIKHLSVLELPRSPGLVLVHKSWRSIDNCVELQQRYGPAEVDKLIAKGEIFSASRAARAVVKAWFTSFVVQEGYEDGVAGLFVANMAAAYRAVVYMMLWERQGKPNGLKPSTVHASKAVRRLYVVPPIALRRARGALKRVRAKAGI